MKKILLAATGSVAVSKLPALVALLKKKYEVKVIASNYVLNNYSDAIKLNPIIEDTSLDSYPQHIELAKWADLIMVVPASANTLAKFYAGIADNPLLTTLIAARNNIIFVPAMNTYMYQALVKRNIIDNLANMGHAFIGPEVGMLKEGEVGLGRMSEPEVVAKIVDNYFLPKNGKVVVSYGGSRVAIDKIRYIGNSSSGKMGKLIINELRLAGYKVVGLDVSTMSNKEALNYLENNSWDTYISAAAFADVDLNQVEHKLRKEELKVIDLKPNIDVIETIRKEYPDRKIIGFKHDDDKKRALAKKEKLNLNLMVWNKIGAMGSEKISGEIIGTNYKFDNINKGELAKKIVEVL